MIDKIFSAYIPKFIVDLDRANEDVRFVSTSYFAPDGSGDVFILDKRTVRSSALQTTQSLQELQPDVSDKYPFKIVTPLDVDGATIIQVPTIEGVPTASQHYYAPMFFERYNQEVVNRIDKSFKELSDPLTGNTDFTEDIFIPALDFNDDPEEIAALNAQLENQTVPIFNL